MKGRWDFGAREMRREVSEVVCCFKVLILCGKAKHAILARRKSSRTMFGTRTGTIYEKVSCNDHGD